jgi:hypothetical protein
MAGFLGPLRIEEMPGDDRQWRLLEPCIYHLQTAEGAEWVEAPIDFPTDFGSIPRPLWGLPGLSPFGKLRRAYVIHDKLYQAPVVRTATSARAIDRAEADRILLEACAVLGANWLNRKVIYRAVRIGGRMAWNRYRRADRDESLTLV